MIREREREREGAAAPKNTHDFENDSKEKELRFFKKKKKKKKKKTDHCVLSSLRNTTRIISSLSNNNNRPQQIAAAGAAAVMLFNSAPAHAEIMGLTLQNGVPNAAAQKFVQPFVPDGRPVVYVEKDGAGDITTKEGRIAPNVARSNVGCKTITGQPCVDFVSGK